MNPRQQAKDLVRLATDEGTSEHERLAAAVKACAVIRKNKLLDNPLDAVEDMFRSEEPTMRAGKKLYETFTDPGLIDALKTLGSRLNVGKKTRARESDDERPRRRSRRR